MTNSLNDLILWKITKPRRYFCGSFLLLLFGVGFGDVSPYVCTYCFSSVYNPEWPPFWKELPAARCPMFSWVLISPVPVHCLPVASTDVGMPHMKSPTHFLMYTTKMSCFPCVHVSSLHLGFIFVTCYFVSFRSISNY